MTLQTFPAELVLRILAYLPVQVLRNLRLTSRSWNSFFVENQSSIYHSAALLHNFIDSIQTLLPEAKEAHPLKFLQDVPDWYQFCRKYFQLQRNWLGAGSAKAKFYGSHSNDVHRIKVDEDTGILIATHAYGGLTVFDLETTDILWRLEATYVSRFVHCEYEKGYLIFERGDASKEVWRLEVLHNEADPLPLCTPDDAQMDAWRFASRRHQATSPRGHFRPWALIAIPDFTRASRFLYPTLLVCGLRRAYLWDVLTGAYITHVDKVQGTLGGNGNINYVELSERHVFVCSTSALRIFSRQNGAMVLEVPSYQLVYADVRLAVHLDPALVRQKVAGPAEAVYIPAMRTDSTVLYNASYAEFTSVHVSRSGKDLVAQLSDSRVYILRDFERVIRGEIPLVRAALEVGKILPRMAGSEEHFAIYHAFAHGRAGFVTTSGIYVGTLDPTYHGFVDEDLILKGQKSACGVSQASVDADTSYPYIRFVSLPFYHDRRQLAKVSCIQMTESKLYFVWDEMYKPGNFEFYRKLGIIGDETLQGGEGDEEDDSNMDSLPLSSHDIGPSLMHEDSDDGEDEGADALGDWDDSAYMSGGAAVSGDTPGAGPSTVSPGADGAEVEEDAVDDDEDSSDDDGNAQLFPDSADFAGTILRNQNFSRGLIVFCVDFSPE